MKKYLRVKPQKAMKSNSYLKLAIPPKVPFVSTAAICFNKGVEIDHLFYNKISELSSKPLFLNNILILKKIMAKMGHRFQHPFNDTKQIIGNDRRTKRWRGTRLTARPFGSAWFRKV